MYNFYKLGLSSKINWCQSIVVDMPLAFEQFVLNFYGRLETNIVLYVLHVMYVCGTHYHYQEVQVVHVVSSTGSTMGHVEEL